MSDEAHHPAPTKCRRVELSSDDVDVIQRVAKMASTDRWRPALMSVHCIDGIAFATDSYRFAFAEVDCDDCVIPAKAAGWLPFDGGTIAQYDHPEPGHMQTEVRWGDLGGTAYRWNFPGKDFFDFLTNVTGPAPTTIGRPPTDHLPVALHNVHTEDPMVLVGAPIGGVVAVNEKFLRSIMRILDPVFIQCGLGSNRVWLWDNEITCIVMPIRLSRKQAWTWEAARAA